MNVPAAEPSAPSVPEFWACAWIDTSGAHLPIRGDLDVATISQLVTLADRVLDKPTVDTVTVFLAGVTSMDSSGIGALLQIHHRARALGKTVRVAGAPPPIRRVLQLTGVESELDVL